MNYRVESGKHRVAGEESTEKAWEQMEKYRKDRLAQHICKTIKNGVTHMENHQKWRVARGDAEAT